MADLPDAKRPEGLPFDRDALIHEMFGELAERVTELDAKAGPMDTRSIYSRVVLPELAPNTESFLTRAAWAFLGAVRMAEIANLDVTSGDAA